MSVLSVIIPLRSPFSVLRSQLSVLCYLLTDRQADGKGGALSYLRVNADSTMMQIYDMLHYVETDTSAWLVVLSLEERFEDTLAVFLTYAHAVVADDETEMFLVGLNDTAYRDVLLTVFIGVGEQVADHLGDGLSINDGREVLIRIIHLELSAVLQEGGLETFADGMEQLVDIAWLEITYYHVLLSLAEVK